MGEAVRDHMTVAGKGADCVALGIAPWGATVNKLALDGTDVSRFRVCSAVWYVIKRFKNLIRY